MSYIDYMQAALNQAQQGMDAGEVPVGAIVVYQKKIIAKAYNQPIALHDPTAHAEILALRQAADYLKNYRLDGCDLYVTLEPCVMCTAAMMLARIERCYFGAYDQKSLSIDFFQHEKRSEINHRIEWIGGVLEKESQALLAQFFQAKREQ